VIAFLGMYDRPETAEANDRLWAAIREALDGEWDVPETLDRKSDPWSAWTAKNLLLAQTCGCPLRTRLYGEVQLIGTADYGHAGCAPGHYYSVFVARKDADLSRLSQLDGKVFAYNDGLSQSGWAGPLIHMQDEGMLPGELLETGGHRESALAVAEGRADFAALDILSWELMQQYDDFAADLQAFERTAETPGLPFITAIGNAPDVLFKAIETAISNLDEDTLATLHLKGIVQIPMSDYLAVPTPPGPVLTGQKIRARAKA